MENNSNLRATISFADYSCVMANKTVKISFYVYNADVSEAYKMARSVLIDLINYREIEKGCTEELLNCTAEEKTLKFTFLIDFDKSETYFDFYEAVFDGKLDEIIKNINVETKQ